MKGKKLPVWTLFAHKKKTIQFTIQKQYKGQYNLCSDY